MSRTFFLGIRPGDTLVNKKRQEGENPSFCTVTYNAEKKAWVCGRCESNFPSLEKAAEFLCPLSFGSVPLF